VTSVQAPPAGHAPPAAPRASTSRRLAVAWLELAVLWTFAIALPLFQLLDDSPDFLVAAHNGWPDIVLVAVALVVVPPTLGVAVEAALGRRPDIAATVHLIFLGGLFAALVLQGLKAQFDPTALWLYVAALLAGGAFAYLYRKGPFLPSMLVVLSPVPLIVLVWFLGFSTASDQAWPQGSEDTQARIAMRAPVVLVVFDELSTASIERDGAINPRLPGFRTLAAGSTWFPNAVTAADNTVRAVPAIFTGRLVGKQAVPVPADHPPSVFDRVEGPLHVIEPITHLCSERCEEGSWLTNARELVNDLQWLMRRRLAREELPELVLPGSAIDDRVAEFEAFSADVRDGLNVLHVELPHIPWQYDADGRKYSDADATETPGLQGETWTKDARAVREGEGRYLAQLAFTDRLLGDLIAAMRRKGIWDRALVIVTADHGLAFTPGMSRRDVRVETFGEIAGVPLFVKAPRQRRGRISRAGVSTLDVVPTIGAVLGADWRLPGHSLLRPRSRRDAVVAAQFGRDVRMPLPYFEALRTRAAARLAAARPAVPER
jgi:hypothetical protein